MRNPVIKPVRVFDREPEKNRPIAALERQTRDAVHQLGSQKVDPHSFSPVLRTGLHRAQAGEIVLCEPAGAAGVKVLLPPPSPALRGRQVTVKKTIGGADPVVVSVADGSDVDGTTSFTAASAKSLNTFACDGATWWRVV